MLLTDARRPARATADGSLIPLAEQDRTRWTKQQITEGVALVSASLGRGPLGPCPVVTLNRAVAVARTSGPFAGLAVPADPEGSRRRPLRCPNTDRPHPRA